MELNIKQISARSKRQLMDWSLVLASQGIEASLCLEEDRWLLSVSEEDFPRAQAAIDLYQRENRGWRWSRHLPKGGFKFHWGALPWLFALALIYAATVRWPGLVDAGLMDRAAVRSGQWWRLGTAVLLHADAAHLLGNLAIGFVFVGLAMGEYGWGIALLAAFLGGVGGNLAGYLVYPNSHRGLGASGAVTAAIGLLVPHPALFLAKDSLATRWALKAVAACAFLFILLGTNPRTDVVAHFGGFVVGTVLGFALRPFKKALEQDAAIQWMGFVTLLGLVLMCWGLALRAAGR
jgi:rhomboid protease GluP